MARGEETEPVLTGAPAAGLRKLPPQGAGLRQVFEAISGELELRPLAAQVARAACDLLGADMALIGLVDEAQQVIRIEAAWGEPPVPPGLESGPGVGLAGQVWLSGRPLLLDRGDQPDPPLLPELADYAMVGVPICRRGPVIGVLGVGAAPPGRFHPEDVEVLTLLAQHAAIAIENVRLYQAEKRRASHIAIINRVGRLVSGSLHLDHLLQTAVEATAAHLRHPHIAILLADPANPETLVLRAKSGIFTAPEINPYHQTVNQGIIGTAARTRQRRLVNDVRHDPHYLRLPGADNIYAELAVPIVVGDRLLGVLNVESEQPISEADAEGYEIIADQLGVAIDNARLFAGIRSALEQARLLYETSQRISTAMDVDEVIRAYLEQVAVRGRYACHIVLYDYNEAGERMEARVRARWTPEEGVGLYLDENLPDPAHSLDVLLDAGQTVTIADAQQEDRVPPGLRQLQLKSQRRALALIPLVVGERRVGLVVLSHPYAHAWPETDLQPYQATAAQLATAIDHRQQYRLLYERGQQIAVLQERQRLARELHDSVTQLIFSVTLIAQSIRPAWQRDPAEGERRIARLLELSQLALVEMRALLAELRPSEALPPAGPVEPAHSLSGPPVPGIHRIQQEGLVPVLHQHLADVTGEGLVVDFDPAGYIPQDSAVEEALYRITQEALNNVLKHARARRVKVRLAPDGQAISLTVTDDGIGLSPVAGEPEARPAVGTGGGLGLRSMRERAAALGGMARVTALPEGGTMVAVTIPRKDRLN